VWHSSSHPAFSVGNRGDDPLQKVGSNPPVVACKNTATTFRRHSLREVGRGGHG